MKVDARGLAVTTDAGAVIGGIDDFTIQFLSARDGAAAIFDVAADHPDCALAQMYAAAMHLYSQSTGEIACNAQPFLRRAAAQRARLSERERCLLDALEAWTASDFQGAIARYEHIAETWPRDIVAAKLGEFLFYQAPDYQRHLRFIERVAPANADVSPAKAMHAFALELCGQYDRAESVARDAIAQDLYTPWAHHALAHLHLNQGRIGEGLAVQEELAPTWTAHSQATLNHNMWHVALFHLADLQLDRALDRYHDLWGHPLESVLEHVDAISLLWRVELAGRPVPDEWSAIVAHLGPYPNEQVFPFLNAHYVYALARAQRTEEARRSVELMRRHAQRQQGHSAHVWGDLGVALAQGCIAFAEGDHARAAVLLDPIQPELYLVGGSDAQNDLFKQTYLLSLIGSKRPSEAANLLERRIGARPPTALEERWRSRL